MNQVQKRKKKQFFISSMLLAAIIAGSSVSVYATEAVEGQEQITTYIYHQHIGSSEAEGGCYQTPIYHSHKGSESEGGDCYETPVYHQHTGDESSGGICYGTPVCHVHEGDGTTAEGCYTAVYHSHSGSCYEEIDDDDYGCYTVRYWDTGDGDYEGHDYKYYEMSCGRTIHGTNSSHTHNVLSCSRGSEITGYTLGCGLTEESITGYLLSCEKTAETIDSYLLSCEKTSEDIDGYERSCGKEENDACGAIVITKQTIDTLGAMAFVKIEDYTGGELNLSENPFCWYDEQGNIIGTGDSISVSENGTYKVKAEITNEDINGESLWAQVDVDNIRPLKPSEPEDDDNDGADDDESESDEFAGGGTSSEEGIQTPLQTPTPTPVPTPTPTPTPTPASKTGKTNRGDGQNENRDAEQDMLIKTDETAAYRPEKDKKEEVTATPALRKETEVVKAEEIKSAVAPLEEPKEVRRDTFFTSPAAKVVMLTAGTFSLLTGLFLLFYLFRQSVRIYNDDGQGNMNYLGRCMVRLTDDGYLAVLSQQMTEKALTNRYCIKPGLFAVGKKEEELLIEKQGKRISVPLQKEMIAVI